MSKFSRNRGLAGDEQQMHYMWRIPRTKQEYKELGSEIYQSRNYSFSQVHSMVKTKVSKCNLPIHFELEKDIIEIKTKVQTQLKKPYLTLQDDPVDIEGEHIKLANMLEHKLKQDKTCAIESSLIFSESLKQYKVDKGLVERMRVGDTIVQEGSTDNIQKLIKKHCGHRVRMAARQIREVLAIQNGNFAVRPKQSKLSQQDSVQKLLDINTRIAETPLITSPGICRSNSIDLHSKSRTSLPSIKDKSSLHLRSKSMLSQMADDQLKQIATDRLIDESLKTPVTPNFLTPLYAGSPSKDQLEKINSLVSQFYNENPPVNPQLQKLHDVQKVLNKVNSKTQLKLNQNEKARIRKENNGRGAALKLHQGDDQQMQAYSQYITRLMTTLSRDHFLIHKLRLYDSKKDALDSKTKVSDNKDVQVEIDRLDKQITEHFKYL